MSALRKKMIRDLELRRFSVSTQKAYISAVRGLAKYYMLSPDKISEEQLLEYVHFLITKRKLSCSSLNVATAGLRFSIEKRWHVMLWQWSYRLGKIQESCQKFSVITS